MEIKNGRACLKQLGILGMHSECPNGCRVMQIVSGALIRNKSTWKEVREEIAQKIGEGQCPSGVRIVLRKGSCRLNQ